MLKFKPEPYEVGVNMHRFWIAREVLRDPLTAVPSASMFWSVNLGDGYWDASTPLDFESAEAAQAYIDQNYRTLRRGKFLSD